MPANTYIFSLVNPGAEAGSLTGWTANSTFRVDTAGGAPFGSWYFYGGRAVNSAAYQDVVISNPAANTDIDTGLAVLNFSWWQTSAGVNDDPGTVSIHYMNGAGAPIINTALPLISYTGWQKREYVETPIPVGTRIIRVRMNAVRTSGLELQVYFDNLSDLQVVYNGAIPSNLTSQYVELASNTKNESSNLSAEYVEIGFNIGSPESVNLSSEYLEVGFNIGSPESVNLSSQYIEVAANSTPAEPLITAEYVEISTNADITPTITAEYVEIGTKAISSTNVSSQYIELGTKAISQSNITAEYLEISTNTARQNANVTIEYVELSTNTGSGSANVYKASIEIYSGLNTLGNANVFMTYGEAFSTLPKGAANVYMLNSEIVETLGANSAANVYSLAVEYVEARTGGANANVYQMHVEIITSTIPPQVLVAGI